MVLVVLKDLLRVAGTTSIGTQARGEDLIRNSFAVPPSPKQSKSLRASGEGFGHYSYCLFAPQRRPTFDFTVLDKPCVYR